MFGIDVQSDAEAECWSVSLFGFVEKIAFLAEENTRAPSFSVVGLGVQLLVTAFNVDTSATTWLIVQCSINSYKMIEDSPSENLFSLLSIVATYSPIGLEKSCLFGRGGLVGYGSTAPSWSVELMRTRLARPGGELVGVESRCSSWLQ
jgi:hypothetical protein